MAGSITKPKKPKSKRTPVRLRHKIEKASAAKQRKARKDAKNNPQWKSKLKKDPGIPNLFPFKEQMLQQMEEAKMRKQEENQRRRELAKAAKKAAAAEDQDAMDDDDVDADSDAGIADDDDMMDDDDDAGGDDSNPMAALIASARASANKYDQQLQDGSDMDDDDDDDGGMEIEVGAVNLSSQSSNKRAYEKVFKQVVDQADVVLYVLDARDPQGTRSKEVERMVMAAASGGKRLMLILNKIDLIPAQVLKDWLLYLRRYFPTLPLRASGGAPNAQTFKHKDLTPQSTASTLFKSLKSFAASKDLKRAVSVGVIGYPNVGKSSVINALLSRLGGRSGAAKACPAGAEAGVTTSIRSVKMDKQLTLLDSPGVIFPNTDGSSLVSKKNAVEAHAQLVLLNAVPPKQIEDPIPAVTLLLKRLASSSPNLLQKMLDVYDLPPLMTDPEVGDATTDFLVQVARKRGRLSRGGIPNMTAAAMTVVMDWRDGRIQGWVDAPVLPVALSAGAAKKAAASKPAAANATAEAEATAPDQKKIVTEWAKEFNLDDVFGALGGAGDDDADAMEQ